MTDPEPLRKFAAIIGIGKFYGPYKSRGGANPKWSPYFAWTATKKGDALAAVEMLLPWLSTRRRDSYAEVKLLVAERDAGIAEKAKTCARGHPRVEGSRYCRVCDRERRPSGWERQRIRQRELAGA